MRYTLSNTINKPLNEVIDKLKDPEGAKQWIEGLREIEYLSGAPGEVGTKSNLHCVHKKKEMIIVETILEKNFPDQIKFAYQSPMGYNEVEMLFEKLSETSVSQTTNSYFEFKGPMKIMGVLFKGMFKKQSLKYMTAFKDYVENK